MPTPSEASDVPDAADASDPVMPEGLAAPPIGERVASAEPTFDGGDGATGSVHADAGTDLEKSADVCGGGPADVDPAAGPGIDGAFDDPYGDGSYA